MFNWPENILPLPSFNFNVDVEFSNIRSKMDSGRVRQRPRFTRSLDLASTKFELDAKEYSWFKSLWVNKINNGNDWFNMRLPIPDGEKLTLSEVRFVSDFKANYRPVGNWDVSATLEFKESFTISEIDLDFAISVGYNTEESQEAIEELDTIFPKDWTY